MVKYSNPIALAVLEIVKKLSVALEVSLKGTATLMINTIYKKELYKPCILIPVLSKSVEKWEVVGV